MSNGKLFSADKIVYRQYYLNKNIVKVLMIILLMNFEENYINRNSRAQYAQYENKCENKGKDKLISYPLAINYNILIIFAHVIFDEQQNVILSRNNSIIIYADA